MFDYKNEDAHLSQVALNGLQNYLCYLTEDLVPLPLFDEDILPSERQNLAQKICQQENVEVPHKRVGTGFGKPVFPVVAKTRLPARTLQDFGVADSWAFFIPAKIDPSFLDHPVSSWARLSDYKNELVTVGSLKVVSDVAE